jgi:hypothetical protein
MDLQNLVSLAFSTGSVVATAYLWAVRSSKERPRLKTHLMQLAVTELCTSDDPACCSVGFDLKTAVTNGSVLPNVVFGVAASIRLREGTWLPMRTSFQAYDDESKSDVAFNLPPSQATFLRLHLGTARLPNPPVREEEWSQISSTAAVARIVSDPLEVKVDLSALDGRSFSDVLRFKLTA